MLRLFFGRQLFISKVLKRCTNKTKDDCLKEKFIILAGSLICLIVGAASLYYGPGYFLLLCILVVCVCLYFNEITEEKLE